MAKVILINQRPHPSERGTMLDSIFKRPPNLGLAYIKASLTDSGHRASIVNISTLKDAQRALARHKDADCVGISSLTYTAGNAYRTASFFRSEQIPVVMGGVHASLFPRDAAPHADCLLVGEGEVQFNKILERLERTGGFGPEKIIGAVKDGPGNLMPDPGKRICDIDSLPPPELEDVRQRLHPLFDKFMWPGIPFGVQVSTSRGCPHNCSFCKVPFLQGRRVRAHSAGYIGDLLESYSEQGARSIMFTDDNFSFDSKRVSEICKEIKDRELDLTWFCLCRANWIRSNRPLLRDMRSAGCAMVYYGVESASQDVLDGYGKGITPQDSIMAAKILREEDLGIIVSAILGAKNDTVKSMEDTLEMLRRIGPDMVQVSILWETDRLIDKQYERYTFEHVVEQHPSIPAKVLERLLREFFTEFYGSRENQERMSDNLGWIIKKSLPWFPGFARRAAFRHVSKTIADNFKDR